MYDVMIRGIRVMSDFRKSWTIVAFAAIGFICGTGLESARVNAKSKEPLRDEIVGRCITIVDEKGTKRAAFGIMPDGILRLELRDQAGEVRTWATPDLVGTPGIAIVGKPEKPLIELGSLNEKIPILVLRDSSGARRIGAAVGADGTASLLLSNAHGKTRCELTVNKSGEPRIVVKDARAKHRATVSVQPDGTAALDFWDANGRVRLTAQIDANGQPTIVAWDPNGKVLWSAPK